MLTITDLPNGNKKACMNKNNIMKMYSIPEDIKNKIGISGNIVCGKKKIGGKIKKSKRKQKRKRKMTRKN